MQAVARSVLEQSLRGSADIEPHDDGFAPLRLPRWTRVRQADRWVELWTAQTAGVRLCLRTSATRLTLTVSTTRIVLRGESAPLFVPVALATVGGETVATVPVPDGPLIFTEPDASVREVAGPRASLELALGGDGTERDVTIWLPHNAATVIHGLEADARVAAAAPSKLPRWLHHGSSISHCLDASTPRGTWPQQAAEALGIDVDNFGFGGNAQLDSFAARTLAAQPAAVITLKLGVNVVNADSMRKRAFVPAVHGFLDLVREGHPGTPIVVITPIASPPIEDVPGPTRKVDGRFVGSPRPMVDGDGTLTVGVVRELVREAAQRRAQEDPDLYVLDGRELLSAADAHLLWDGMHPNQDGYDLIATRFVERARDRSTPLGTAFAALLR